MKIKSILLAAASALLLAACDEATNEYHSTYFYPTGTAGVTAYADQTVDSLRVISYDSWSLTNNTEWFDVKLNSDVNNISVNVPSGYVNGSRLDILLQPNTTGKTRSAALQVVSSFGKIGVLSTSVVQYYYLNINHPSGQTLTDGTVSFTLNLSATATNDVVESFVTFTTYNEDATLTSSESWLVPEKTEGFTAGTVQKVVVKAEANKTGAERTATLTLTSGGISTPITVKQPATK